MHSQVFPDVTVTSTAATEPPPTLTTAVTSAAQLQAAIAAGARHIEVQSHLDLTSLQPTDDGFLLGGISASTRTLRVRAWPCAMPGTLLCGVLSCNGPT